jgi:hypothetical protein
VRPFVNLCDIDLKLNLPGGRQARRAQRLALRYTRDFFNSLSMDFEIKILLN